MKRPNDVGNLVIGDSFHLTDFPILNKMLLVVNTCGFKP